MDNWPGKSLLNRIRCGKKIKRPEKIISGGQTGVDRAALDIAIELDIPHGGWCPYGRKAEDGSINEYYHLTETESEDYSERTKLNVRDSDGTLIINVGLLEGGTEETLFFANELKKPVLIIDPASSCYTRTFDDWVNQHDIKILNIAGPRASKQKNIYQQTLILLRKLLVKDMPG